MGALFVIIILLGITACLLLYLLSIPRIDDDGDIYIDDGIDHCKNCELCSKDNCRHCVFNKYNGKREHYDK